MKFNYKLSRLCGACYGVPDATHSALAGGGVGGGGNVVYTSDGNSLISPMSNRIQVLDLVTHTVRTLPLEARSNIRSIALSKDDRLLWIIDVDNYALLVNFQRGIVLHRFHWKQPVRAIEFSPNSKYFAVTVGKHLQVWHSPTLRREFAPFVLHRTYTGLSQDIISIHWSHDSSIILGSSKDGTVKLWTVDTVEGYEPVLLSGHKTMVVGAYFENTAGNNSRIRTIYTVSSDGAMVTWKCTYSDEESDDNNKPSSSFMESSNAALDFFGGGSNNTTTTLDLFSNTNNNIDKVELSQGEHLVKGSWRAVNRHYFHQEKAAVTATAYSEKHNMLVVGFSTGLFGLYELPTVSNIHTLSISSQHIRTVAINGSGEWLAFGCPSTQQLLVWEWRSETHILKQKGHAYGMRCMAYSPDSIVVATGGEDGQIKLWNVTSGFCYCTLSSHTGPITAVTFANSSVVLSASLDGTVRAHDLHRYRNFKTLTAPTPVQFISLAVDPAGELIAAGTTDPFHIYVWSLQTGKLLDCLTGHLGPVCHLTFHPIRGTLASASWDGTVKLWDLYKSENEPETLTHSTDVVCCAFRPDGQHLCAGTIGGTLSIWDVDTGNLLGEIDGRQDISGGRKQNDRMTANHNAASRYFTSVHYSADGQCLLAGGNSKYVCIYEVSQKILLTKFQISYNRSLDGVLDILNSKHLTPTGATTTTNNNNEDSEDEVDYGVNLPGSQRRDDGSRRSRVEVMTSQVAFSSTGREWAAVSKEGLHVYSLDDDMMFDPISLTEEITPGAVQSNLQANRHSIALLMSLHLNEFTLVQQVLEQTPYASIPSIVRNVGPEFLERLLHYLAQIMSTSPHIEFYLQWCQELLQTHGSHMNQHRGKYMRAFRSMHKSIQIQHNELKHICDDNRYTLDFMTDQATLLLNTTTD